MTSRYFVEEPLTGSTALLADSEAHHLLHVMRGKVGDEVLLVDGSGREFTAQVTKVSRRDVELEVLSTAEVDREPAVSITLGVALPKGDRQKWLIEKATELGVAQLVPLETERGVAQPTDKALDRLRRSVIEATKQCGRTRLMEISEAARWESFLQQANANALRLCAHPVQARPLLEILPESANSMAEVILAIGPEGGLTDDEFQQAIDSGWQAVSLGKRILRIETACLRLVSAVLARVE